MLPNVTNVDWHKSKPKQGFLVYHKLKGHVMGIPTDYNNKDYAGIITSVPPINSMLPVPKAQKSSQECVGGNQKGTTDQSWEGHSLFTATWKHFSKKILLENPCWFCWDTAIASIDKQQETVKIRSARTNQTSWWAPFELWSISCPQIVGNMLEVAWERLFIRTSHF